jgi:hypothetical protein
LKDASNLHTVQTVNHLQVLALTTSLLLLASVLLLHLHAAKCKGSAKGSELPQPHFVWVVCTYRCVVKCTPTHLKSGAIVQQVMHYRLLKEGG